MKRWILGLSFLLPVIFSCNNQKNQRAEAKSLAPTDAVNERTFMQLGGVSQYVEITGVSSGKPVLLFIHGGPGWPQTPLLRYLNSDLTKSFILATWDQRGCGRSFMFDSTVTGLSLQQIVEDAHEFTQYLKKKFNQSKIYLAGFSWGSSVGLTLLQKYPADYKAYVGISQVVNINRGMQVSQAWLQQKASAANDAASLQILDKLKNRDSELCATPLDCFMKQYELVAKYGGAVYNPASDSIVQKAMTAYEDYKSYDWNKGFFYSARRLEKDVFATSFPGNMKIAVPAYFIAGRHDWNIPSVLVEEFVKTLDAPHKEIIWFENSAHGPLEEEPAKFNEVLVSKLLQAK